MRCKTNAKRRIVIKEILNIYKETTRDVEQPNKIQKIKPFLWILNYFPAPFCVLNMIKIRKSASKPHVVVRLNLIKL